MLRDFVLEQIFLLSSFLLSVRLTAFRTRPSRAEWKAFNIINANEDLLKKLFSAHKIEDRLLTLLDAKTRLPVSVQKNLQKLVKALLCLIY